MSDISGNRGNPSPDSSTAAASTYSRNQNENRDETEHNVVDTSSFTEDRGASVSEARERMVEDSAREKGAKARMLMNRYRDTLSSTNADNTANVAQGSTGRRTELKTSGDVDEERPVGTGDSDSAEVTQNQSIHSPSSILSGPPPDFGKESNAPTASTGGAVDTPGAFPVPRRAFGQFPVWGRSNPESTEANRRTSSQSRGTSRGAFSRQFRRSSSRMASTSVPQANRIMDAQVIVYPDQVQTTQDLERQQQRDVNRRRYMCGGAILLMVVLSVVGLVVGFQVGVNSGNKDSSNDEKGLDQLCSDLRDSEDPRILLQCEYCGSVFAVSSEVESRFERLTTLLNTTTDSSNASCEPRNLAVIWLANDTIARNESVWMSQSSAANATCPTGPLQLLVQRYVLVLTYFSLNGREWPRRRNWLSTESECDWEGVQCSLGGNQRMFQLDLAGQNAQGTIPEEIGRLCDLRRLELGQNRISGPLPSQLLLQLKSLRRINVANNMLAGAIPDVMIHERLNLTLLNYTQEELDEIEDGIETALLELVDNQLLDGRAPLYDLDFSGNRFDGTIPYGFRLLRHLREVKFSNNNLTGPLFPNSPLPVFGDASFFKDLEVFDASRNYLEGSIPRSIGYLTRLEYLDVSFNKLTGTLVTELGDLAELTTLRIGGNSIHGTVPTEIENLGRIVDLDLSSRLLEQSLPGELCYQIFLEPPIVVHCESFLQEDCKCCCCRCEEEPCSGRDSCSTTTGGGRPYGN